MKDLEAEYVAFLERNCERMHKALEEIRKTTENGKLPITVEINESATNCLNAVNADNY